MWALVFLAGILSHCGREPEDSGAKGPWKPKKGTRYIGNLPKEIVWLKDGAEMVLVPAGEFLCGEEKEKKYLDSFYIDKYPVTNERYQKFVKATEHRAPYMDNPEVEAFNWKNEKYPRGKGKYPVVVVDWFDVVEFCKWAGKSLPMEEQWEKAARGTDGRRYPWGDEFDEKRCNTYLSRIESPTPVGKFPRGVSPYGCHDMAGNVWEWTGTKREAGYVMRGGSFFEGDVRVRSYSYGWGRPNVMGKNCGFRCCYVPGE